MDLILWLHEQNKLSVFLLLKRLLLDSGPEIRGWICDYLKQKTDHLSKLDHHLIETVSSLIPSDSSSPLSDDVILSALTLLRVLTALRGFVNYVFPPELSSRLLKLLTHPTCVSERGSQYITYALAFLIGLRSSLSCSQDTGNRTDFTVDTERTIVMWLQRLIDKQDYFQSMALSSSPALSNWDALSDRLDAVSVSKPYVEPLLLLAILFHTNQPGPITELISNLLGLRIPSLGRTVNGWRKIFLNSVFTETVSTSSFCFLVCVCVLRGWGGFLEVEPNYTESTSLCDEYLLISSWLYFTHATGIHGPINPTTPRTISFVSFDLQEKNNKLYFRRMFSLPDCTLTWCDDLCISQAQQAAQDGYQARRSIHAWQGRGSIYWFSRRFSW
ncbi:unnamed protein product [Echinostoma caproni]|uniref:Maestro heat-like repeat family member 5 n=1 Tax=Echinostoma caproni TaxID=27848 RepID=A0A183AUE0_9TREM|nr:unnamed protein product [Echinostoma caproni]